MKTTHDIVIIGAGPAGAVASLSLSNAGQKHLLLEAQTMPRNKSCADIVTSKAIRSLERVAPGLVDDLKQKGHLKEIWGTTIYTTDQHLDLPYEPLDGKEGVPSCYSISREELDGALWKRIADINCAEMRDGTRVKHIEKTDYGHSLTLDDGSEITTPLLLIGTGSSSGLVNRLEDSSEHDRHTAIGIRAYYKGVAMPDESRCELYLDKETMPGGFYIAPLTKGVYNVNVVIRKDKLLKDSLDLKSVFEDFMTRHPLLGERFENAVAISTPKGCALKLGTRKRDIVSDGLMLIGDAAGLIDLLSANGIPQAMISGEIAAATALDCTAKGDYSTSLLKQYSTALAKRIKSDLALGRLLSPMLSYPWFNGLMHGLFDKMSDGKTIQRMIYSERPVSEFLKSLLPERIHPDL